MSAAQLPPGTVIDGRYTLSDVLRTRLGATVYAAADSEGNAADVTIYGAECFPSALVRERSLRELRQLQGLESPRVVSVLGCGKRDDGGAFEVTNAMRDPLVTQALSRGPWPEQDAAALLVQVGEALLVAQKVGVIHRNLGPTVIHAGPSGACLGGFAVGEPQGEAAFGPSMTIAPEQVEGKIVDQRTLIFNLAALMQTMLAGAPPYAGEGIDVLRAYIESEPGVGTHAGLKRALSRDARMRPMMLRQFLGELGAIGGVDGPSAASIAGQSSPVAAPPAGATPTSRGWTMFMKEDAADASADPEENAPAAPVAVPAGAKPSSRGWTMFMEAASDEPAEAESEPAATPAPVAEAKPSTRGWTMFMEAADEDADPQPADPSTAATKPATPAAAPGDKPSSRGWTMFMEDEDDGTASPTSPAPDEPEPAVSTAAVASTEAAATAAPATPAKKASPSTRGWTMFMEDEAEGDDATEAAPAPAQPGRSQQPVAAAAPAAAQAEGPSAPSAAPASSGWTMFQEPSEAMPPLEASAAPTAVTKPEPVPAATEDVAPQPEAEPDKPVAKKRGWTMFMEAPIPRDGDGKTLGGPDQAPPAAATPATDEPQPSATPSTQKGWTVFGAEAQLSTKEASGADSAPVPSSTSPVAAQAPASRARAHTVVSSGPLLTSPDGGSSNDTLPAPGGPVESANPVPQSPVGVVGSGPVAVGPSATSASKTVVATGVVARAGADGGVTSRAELQGAEAGLPTGVPNAIAPRPSTEIAKASSNTGLLVAVAAVVVVGGALAAWALVG